MRWQPARGATEAGGSVAKFIHRTVGGGFSASPCGFPSVFAHDLAAGFLQSGRSGRQTERQTDAERQTSDPLFCLILFLGSKSLSPAHAQ